jgi:hypothetical protein
MQDGNNTGKKKWSWLEMTTQSCGHWRSGLRKSSSWSKRLRGGLKTDDGR